MSVSAYDEKLFDAACEDIIEKERAKNGIGTLQEKQCMLYSSVFMNRITLIRKYGSMDMLRTFSAIMKSLKYRPEVLMQCEKN